MLKRKRADDHSKTHTTFRNRQTKIENSNQQITAQSITEKLNKQIEI